METAGLVVGLAGLAGLFNVCNSTFQLVQRGRAFPQDYRILETKFNNQELRLRAWGRAWGLVDDTHYDERLEEPDLNRQLVATLECIKLLLNDAEQLKDRYGLKQCIRPAGGSQSDSSASMTSSPSYLDRGSRLERRRSFNPLLRLRSRPDQNRPNSRGSAAMWAIDDRQKFAELVKHLKEFIDDLEDLTKVPEIRYRQRVFVHYEIECIEDVEELEDIEMAREGDEDVVSDAASVRLEQLSQGTPSVRASMESLGSSFTLESYFTARSHISSNLSIADSASWGRISVEHDVAAHNPISSQSSLEAIRHKIKEGRYTPAERLSMLLSTPSSLSPFLLKGRVKECYKCVVIGEISARKSNLLFRFTKYGTGSYPHNYLSTTFDELVPDISINGQQTRLKLEDTSGLEDYESIFTRTSSGADVLIICFLLNESPDYDQVRDKWGPSHFKNTPSVLVGMEPEGSYLPSRSVYSSGIDLAKEIGAATYIQCNVDTGANVDDVFATALRIAMRASGAQSPSRGFRLPWRSSKNQERRYQGLSMISETQEVQESSIVERQLPRYA